MVIPLRDINVRHIFPVVTIALIAANVAVFFYELSLGGRLQEFFVQSAFIPREFFEGEGVASQARPVMVSMFLHGGWLHLLGNMLYLWIFGDNVEDRMGHVRFLGFYVICGWIATLAHAYTNPESSIPAIGASGAISGVLGAYLIMFPRARVITLIPLGFFIRISELPAMVVLGLWFLLQLISGVGVLGAQAGAGGVAWWAHIGGFVAGMFLGFFFRYPRRPKQAAGFG